MDYNISKGDQMVEAVGSVGMQVFAVDCMVIRGEQCGAGLVTQTLRHRMSEEGPRRQPAGSTVVSPPSPAAPQVLLWLVADQRVLGRNTTQRPGVLLRAY